MKEITRYDFCVDDIGNEAFMPCPDGRYVLLEEVEAYLPDNEEYNRHPLIPIDFDRRDLVTKEVDKSIDENYIYLPMKKGVRTRYDIRTGQFEQTKDIDERILWTDHVERAKFHTASPTKEMNKLAAELLLKRNQK